MAPLILLVDDDHKTVNLIRLYLERDGYDVVCAHDGVAALDAARQHQPDLIVLDLMLPTIDGLDVCRVLRAESRVSIIMLTAKSTENDRVLGLDLGADDYLTKPFSPRELLARIRAVLRRTGDVHLPGEDDCVTHQDLAIDFRRRTVSVSDQEVHLTPKEYEILALMASEPGRAFSRAQLQDQAFGFDYDGLERTIDVHIMNLRKKIETDPSDPAHVLTVYGYGYKFAEDDDAS